MAAEGCEDGGRGEAVEGEATGSAPRDDGWSRADEGSGGAASSCGKEKRPRPSPARGSAKSSPDAKRMKCALCGGDMGVEEGELGEEDEGVVKSPLRKCQKCEESFCNENVADRLPPFPAFPAFGDSGKGATGEEKGFESGRAERGQARGSGGRKGGDGRSEEAAAGECANDGGGRGAASWKDFTPKEVDEGKCMARTWLGGRGGQCRSGPVGSGRYCKMHGQKQGTDKWLGAVDGPIPEKKMNEFVKERQKLEGARKEVGGGAARRLRRAGFAFEAERGGDGSAATDEGGVGLMESACGSECADSTAGPAAVGALAAHAAEARRAAEADRGIGDKAKVELMRKRSDARARRGDV